MVDFAHRYDGAEVMMPVYVDDEGTPARDAVLIERGILRGFMNSRETAARLGRRPTGSARAYGPDDEPLVRMRNTAILPGSSKLDEMIAGVDDGYLLLNTGNGQADSTTEFMFGITLAYEIQGGRSAARCATPRSRARRSRCCRAWTRSSDDMVWSCQRLLRQEAADGGVDGRPGAARPRAPGRRVRARPADHHRLQATAERALALMRAQGFEQAQVSARLTHRPS